MMQPIRAEYPKYTNSSHNSTAKKHKQPNQIHGQKTYTDISQKKTYR